MPNIFADLPTDLNAELVQVLVDHPHVRLERIVSTGQASPPGFWYDQDEHEWVVLVRGEAKLLLEDEASPIHLGPGDYVTIPAHRKHRVVWTTPAEPTVWLAMFYKD